MPLFNSNDNNNLIPNKNKNILKKNILSLIFDKSSLILLYLNKHLKNIYKATTLFRNLLVPNKYLLISFILLGIISFYFNKNLDYFNDLTIENISNINSINIKSVILLCIAIYLCYIKLNLLIRGISLIKSIPFFYREIKINLIKNIIQICIYYYIFNLFFFYISIVFIINLISNIYIINNDLGVLIDYLTNITSILTLCFNLKKF